MLRRRKSNKKAENEGKIVEGEEEEEEGVELDKRFGFSKELKSKLEVKEEVGRGHFGYTCSAKFKKGEFKDQQVAVKVIPKSKVWSSVFILFSKFIPFDNVCNWKCLILSSSFL